MKVLTAQLKVLVRQNWCQKGKLGLKRHDAIQPRNDAATVRLRFGITSTVAELFEAATTCRKLNSLSVVQFGVNKSDHGLINYACHQSHHRERQ